MTLRSSNIVTVLGKRKSTLISEALQQFDKNLFFSMHSIDIISNHFFDLNSDVTYSTLMFIIQLE